MLKSNPRVTVRAGQGSDPRPPAGPARERRPSFEGRQHGVRSRSSSPGSNHVAHSCAAGARQLDIRWESTGPPAPRLRGMEGTMMAAVGGIGIIGVIVVVLIVLAIVYLVRRS